MKYQFKRTNKKAISLDPEDFAVLSDFSNGKSTYKFTYSIDTAVALSQGAQKVEISVFPSNQPKPPSIFTLNSLSSKPSPLLLVKNIQQITAIKKDTKNANTNAKLANVTSDFTTKISNSSPFASFTKKKFNLALAPVISQKSKVEPILKINNFPLATISQSSKSLAIKSILQNSEDPSNIKASFSLGTTKAMQGMISDAQVSLTLKPFTKKLVQKTLSQANIKTSQQASETTVIPILAQEGTGFTTITKTIDFGPGNLIGFSDFIVEFSLVGPNGLVVEKAKMTVEHSRNIRIAQTPVLPPSITSITLPARNLLTITQNDPLATSVDIFRKIFNRTSRIEEQNYVFVGNLAVSKKGGPAPFEDLIGNASDMIYRVIPKGEQQQLGSIFTNKVVKAYKFGLSRERTQRLLYAGIVAQSDPKGIRIEVLGLAPGVSAIKLLARDRTRKETNFKTVKSLIGKTDTVVISESGQAYSFLDTFSKKNNVIEYAVMMLFENGDEQISTTREIFKNIPFSFGVVDTRIGQPRILQVKNGIDIQFNIESSINSSNIENLKKLLEQQGQASIFTEDLINEKNSLNNLIAHQIRRIDLTTGETVFFRPFTGTVFSDERNRKIDGISAPIPGRVYRYIVSALFRKAETLFENNVKTITNSIGISVNYLPLKFKHPVVSQYGNIVTTASLLANHSETQFEFGNIGNFTKQDISIDISKPQIFNARVSKFNKDTNFLKWNITGDKNTIEHFLVILDKFGDEEVIGAVHANFNSNVIEYIDKEAPKEPGSYRYKIIPVLKDYTQGPAITTQEFI